MSNGERWPAGSAYVAAVQHPQSAFSDPRLQQAQLRGGLLGLPASASGQNAIVFPATTTTGEIAIRCFTTPARSGRERYDALAAYLALRPCDAMTRARWLDDGIRVDANTWPIVEMDWALGIPLHQAVAQHRSDPTQLNALAETWRAVMCNLHDNRIAHGDLQHGNVLVDTAGRLRLVDFDGVWVPPTSELVPREVGHPNYQHPQRLETGAWGEHIDAFSALVIYLSLRALATDSTLWDHHNGENLILTATDYQRPDATDTWTQLAANPDPEVVEHAELLGALCRTTVNIDTNLDHLLDTHQIPDAPTYQPARDTNANTWWQSTNRPAVAYTEPTRVHAQVPPIPPGPQPSRARWGIPAAIIVLLLVVIGVAIAATTGHGSGNHAAATPRTAATNPPTTPPTVATTTPAPPLAPALAAPSNYQIFVVSGSCNTSTCQAYGTFTDNSSAEVTFRAYLVGGIAVGPDDPTLNGPGSGETIKGATVSAPVGQQFCTYVVARSANGQESTPSNTICSTFTSSGGLIIG